MSDTVSSIVRFIERQDRSFARTVDIKDALQTLLAGEEFRHLLIALVEAPAFSRTLGTQFAAADAISGISPCRVLRGALNLSLDRFFALMSQLVRSFDRTSGHPTAGVDWQEFADQVHRDEDLAGLKLARFLTTAIDDRTVTEFYMGLVDRLVTEHPHAIYPTSDYRECDGYVESTADGLTIEAVTSFSTFTSLRIIDHSLELDQSVLRDMYRSFGRCVCLVDDNVERSYGLAIEAYFRHHGIVLHKQVYRAMEVDKGISTVEKMLGDFKRFGVSRNEPVLLIGGGVLADTGGLACAMYGRNTPYVMLATSIVTGIDAGPSPRTCCDGFGYKNVMGAYHPPVLCITDRYFFKTLREGWLRHGIAEIIKMGIVADEELFANLETAQPMLIETKFGTVDCAPGDEIQELSQRILGGALKAYVASEYDNLYETHQCRPHAYGHTWSPGFEIEAGMLHGHAVSVCMGFGAFLSRRSGWIKETEFTRIMTLLDGYGLSMWHDVLSKKDTIWKSQQTVTQKRGQNLVAPIPKGGIGRCGYLNELSQADLYSALDEYQSVCKTFPRAGRGIDPHCQDVGLEDPSTVMPTRAA